MSKLVAAIVEIRDFESIFFDRQTMLILPLILVCISFQALVGFYFIDWSP